MEEDEEVEERKEKEKVKERKEKAKEGEQTKEGGGEEVAEQPPYRELEWPDPRILFLNYQLFITEGEQKLYYPVNELDGTLWVLAVVFTATKK